MHSFACWAPRPDGVCAINCDCHCHDDIDYDIGTCQGCGAYGRLGDMHTRNSEECGEYL
jgi:hypothetical protein